MQKKSQPDKVSTALTLLWITIAIGVIRSIMEFSNTSELTSFGLGFGIFIAVFAFVIVASFIYMIGRGKNWARITFLVFFIIGIPLAGRSLFQSLLRNPVSGILGIVEIILEIIALVFLFQKPSSDWFKSIKK